MFSTQGLSVTPNRHLFTDGSFDPQSGVGYGASLLLPQGWTQHLNTAPEKLRLESLTSQIRLRRFTDTNCNKLELQILLRELREILLIPERDRLGVTIYTDSQTIIDLPQRRPRLQQNDYFASSGKRLNNHELYREFFPLTDELNCVFIKVAGHQPSHARTPVETLFGLVDRAARQALRSDLRSAAQAGFSGLNGDISN